jgi:hypothetical protein
MHKLFLFLVLGPLLVGLLTTPSPVEKTPAVSEGALFPVTVNGLWGFMDTAGSMVISPRFKQAGMFSEGLAPVRHQGRYGYIDRRGTYVIPPRYDYAYGFANGRAVVYRQGKKYLTNRAGEVYFEHDYPDWEFASEQPGDLFIVTTHSEKQGVIDISGTLVVDTVYRQISPFVNGLAVVEGLEHNPDDQSEGKPRNYQTGVINSTGRMIVRYGTYKRIHSFVTGYAKVDLREDAPEAKQGSEGVIDTTGTLRFVIPDQYSTDESPYFSEGLSVVTVWSTKDSYSSYEGVIDTKGKLVINNPAIKHLTPFQNNRSFIMTQDKEWFLIDRSGKRINPKPYRQVVTEGFAEGMAWVETSEGVTAIDTNGKILLTPRKLTYNQGLYKDSVLYFMNWDSATGAGYWDLKTNTVVSPSYTWVDYTTGFSQGLLLVGMHRKVAYVDRTGKVVWQQEEATFVRQRMDIDYMNRGYFYVSESTQPDDEKGYEGVSYSYMHLGDDSFPANTFAVLAKPEETSTFAKAYEGITLYVANTQSEPVFFEVQDGRLSINLQALDEKGQWRDIEYLPRSWCGNSYYPVFLRPHSYWKFTIPHYEGELKTLLRARLEYQKTEKQKKPDVMYSNTFEGSVNPGQFWRKPGYVPHGLMDPYTE